MSFSSSFGSVGSYYNQKLYFDHRADQEYTGGYWITDDQLREKLSNLIDTEEKIENASVYSNPLSSLQATNALLYHAFIVMKTNNWWWSIEKNSECITIQRAKNLESVRDKYQRTKRTTGLTPLTQIRENETTEGGNTTIRELINYIWRGDCLKDVYHILMENCQIFANLIFARINSPRNDQVYFDEAADQPPSSANSYYMNVDQVFNEVQRLSASENFTKLEIYKAPISSHYIPVPLEAENISSILKKISGYFSHHYFVIFETNEGTYWSFERFPTSFTIQRARNKQILLKECQRELRDTLLLQVNLEKSDVAKRQNMKAVLDFTWKEFEPEISYVPARNCDTTALQIYDKFKMNSFAAQKSWTNYFQ
ncbi:uncharacterized protein LOC132088081 [Daphnia carinata]|uniref:uncharacterized protein LOC132088081 n=1 Tax=Daphnia carinata TaxID=120202 RepID=UPI002868E8A2|nr:uncharacterized protein LOC132088081 [Daphnia carinata]